MEKIYTMLVMIFFCFSVIGAEVLNPLLRISDTSYDQSANIDPVLCNYLLTGNVDAFERMREVFKKKGQRLVEVVGKDVLSNLAKKGEYNLWAVGFAAGYTKTWRRARLHSVSAENRHTNKLKRLFFGAEWGDFFYASDALDYLNKSGTYNPHIKNANNKTPYEIARENGYTHFGNYLYNGGFSSKESKQQEQEKKLILDEILEINKDHLLKNTKDIENNKNYLSWHLVKNSPELANHPSYKDTILAWLLKQHLPFVVERIDIKNAFIEIFLDEKIWDLVDRETLLIDEKNFLATFAARTEHANGDLFAKVSNWIKKGRFLSEFKQFWDYKDLIDQGMKLDTKFYSKKYGWQTLAELAANMEELALALAFKDGMFWKIFDKEKLFEHVRQVGTQLNLQMQHLIDI